MQLSEETARELIQKLDSTRTDFWDDDWEYPEEALVEPQLPKQLVKENFPNNWQEPSKVDPGELQTLQGEINDRNIHEGKAFTVKGIGQPG